MVKDTVGFPGVRFLCMSLAHFCLGRALRDPRIGAIYVLFFIADSAHLYFAYVQCQASGVASGVEELGCVWMLF